MTVPNGANLICARGSSGCYPGAWRKVAGANLAVGHKCVWVNGGPFAPWAWLISCFVIILFKGCDKVTKLRLQAPIKPSTRAN